MRRWLGPLTKRKFIADVSVGAAVSAAGLLPAARASAQSWNGGSFKHIIPGAIMSAS